jgi:hypothetical protein
MVNGIESGKPKGKTLLFVRKNKTTEECCSAILGERKGIRATLRFSAFIGSIAKIDPGTFTTNIQGSSQCGYKMLWVVILAKSASKYVS